MTVESTDITTWDFPTLKTELEARLDRYANVVYSDDNIKAAEEDRSMLGIREIACIADKYIYY